MYRKIIIGIALTALTLEVRAELDTSQIEAMAEASTQTTDLDNLDSLSKPANSLKPTPAYYVISESEIVEAKGNVKKSIKVKKKEVKLKKSNKVKSSQKTPSKLKVTKTEPIKKAYRLTKIAPIVPLKVNKPKKKPTDYLIFPKQEPEVAEPVNFNLAPFNIKPEKKGHPYLGIIMGTSIAKIGKEQLDVTNAIIGYTNKYLPTSSYYGAVLYGINGGYEFKAGSQGLAALGVGIYQSLNCFSKGQGWAIEDNDHVLDYKYRLYSTRIMVETQFAWQADLRKVKLIPFFSLGVGTALNVANSYQETLIDPTGTTNPGFRSHLSTSLAYQIGVGIACPFNSDYDRLSIAYRYANLGKAHFDTRGDDTSYKLEVGRINAQEVFVTYTHLFDI